MNYSKVTHKNQQSRGQKDTESSNSATSRCSSTIEDQSVSSAAVKRHLKGMFRELTMVKFLPIKPDSGWRRKNVSVIVDKKVVILS